MRKSFPGFPRFLFLGILISLSLLGGTAQAQYVQEDSSGKKQAQRPEEKPAPPSFWDRVSFGGNMGASFGSVTYLEASPVVTYAVTDKFMIGPGVTYIYQSVKANGQRYSSSIYGGRLLSRYILYENIFAQAEVEGLNLPFLREIRDSAGVVGFKPSRLWVVSPLLGGGLRLPLGRRGGVFVTALYNLAYDENRSPYGSPFIFRIGIGL